MFLFAALKFWLFFSWWRENLGNKQLGKQFKILWVRSNFELKNYIKLWLLQSMEIKMKIKLKLKERKLAAEFFHNILQFYSRELFTLIFFR